MTGERLPKSSLIRKSQHYGKVYQEGRRLHGRGFTLISCPNSLGLTRMGISVHRKIRGAVKRNRIKRIIRESFRRDRHLYTAGSDIVFAVRGDFACLCPRDVSASVSSVLEKRSKRA